MAGTPYTYTISVPSCVPILPAGACPGAVGTFDPTVPVYQGFKHWRRVFQPDDVITFQISQPTIGNPIVWAALVVIPFPGSPNSPFTTGGAIIPLSLDLTPTILTVVSQITNAVWGLQFQLQTSDGTIWLIPDPEVQTGTGSDDQP